VNFAKVRSAMWKTKIATAVLLAASIAGPGRASAAKAATPQITIAVMPAATSVGDLGSVPEIAPGLMSPGLGEVPLAQTYLDVSQGNRVFDSLYGGDLAPLHYRGDGSSPISGWSEVHRRADSAPADIVPGLLGSLVRVDVEVAPGPADLLGADEQGAVRRGGGVAPVAVRNAKVSSLPGLISGLRGDDLLIAFARPRHGSTDLVAIGIAGSGYGGNLTSDSTRLGGYVLSTDIAPTILKRLGLSKPVQITGEPIRSEGGRDPAAVASLGDRLAGIPDRRAAVIGVGSLLWLLAIGLVIAVSRGRAARICARLFAVTIAYLPLVLLLTAALDPSLIVERVVVGVGGPLLAALTLALIPGWRGLAVACALTTLACAADVVAGSPLTALSLLGPSPGLGVRFYGIGNELEAILAPLIVVGTGAALAGFAPHLDHRRGALAFLVVGFFFAFVFAAGRFGADVGAAIVFPVGAAVAAAVLTRRRRIVALAIAAPLIAVALLALIDLISGGNAHLTRSVLDAGGLHELGNVAERRLRLSAYSFGRAATSPFLPMVAILIAIGFRYRDRILAWLAKSLSLQAAFAGGAVATVIGTLANDSGALLLEVGSAYLAAFLGFAWAEARARPGPGR